MKRILKLKRCPFCNGKATTGVDNNYYSIGCGDHKCVMHCHTKWESDLDMLVKQWNSRVE